MGIKVDISHIVYYLTTQLILSARGPIHYLLLFASSIPSPSREHSASIISFGYVAAVTEPAESQLASLEVRIPVNCCGGDFNIV